MRNKVVYHCSQAGNDKRAKRKKQVATGREETKGLNIGGGGATGLSWEQGKCAWVQSLTMKKGLVLMCLLCHAIL